MAPAGTNDPPGPRRSKLERFLSLFAEVHPGEAVTALLLFANIFLILTAYYALKQVREAVTISGIELFGISGGEIKGYLPAVMALFLTGVVPAYGLLASRVPRLRLITITTTFIAVIAVVFWGWLQLSGVGTAVGLTFNIWLGIVNVFVIAQFWSYANDVYSEKQGKRLFAIIAVGQSLGAAMGSTLGPLIPREWFFHLPLVSAVLFFGSLVLYRRAERHGAGGEEEDTDSEKERKNQALGKAGGFKLVFSTRYLLLIATMILVTNLVNTTGETILGLAAEDYAEEAVPRLPEAGRREALAEAQAAYDDGEYTSLEAARDATLRQALKNRRGAQIGQFYGLFYLIVNITGVLIQMFLVSRIFKWVGVRGALFVLPLVSLGGYAMIGIVGGLLVLRIAKSAENATDYSLQNTVKQALFLPTSREAKYKAKAAIDTFFVRIGDTLSALLVFTTLHVVGLGAGSLPFVNVGLALLWILINVGIAREHKKMVPDDRAGTPGR